MPDVETRVPMDAPDFPRQSFCPITGRAFADREGLPDSPEGHHALYRSQGGEDGPIVHISNMVHDLIHDERVIRLRHAKDTWFWSVTRSLDDGRTSERIAEQLSRIRGHRVHVGYLYPFVTEKDGVDVVLLEAAEAVVCAYLDAEELEEAERELVTMDGYRTAGGYYFGRACAQLAAVLPEDTTLVAHITDKLKRKVKGPQVTKYSGWGSLPDTGWVKALGVTRGYAVSRVVAGADDRDVSLERAEQLATRAIDPTDPYDWTVFDSEFLGKQPEDEKEKCVCQCGHVHVRKGVSHPTDSME